MRGNCIHVFLILFLCSFLSKAQMYKANELIDVGNYTEAAFILESVDEKGTADQSALVNLAYCYIRMHDYNKAAQIYPRIIAAKKIDQIHYFYFGEVLRSLGKYSEAKEQYNKYLEKFPGDFKSVTCIRSCDSLVLWKSLSSDNKVVNANDINTSFDELCPVSTKDGIFYISNNKDLLVNAGANTDLNDPQVSFIFQKKEGQTTVFRPYSDSISYLAYSVRNGKYAMVVKPVRKTPDGFFAGTPVLKLSNDNKAWNNFQPEETPEGYTITHPCFSEDGSRIYFASDIPGGFGGSDIYYSDYAGGKWNKPVNLGNNINTPGNEMFPYITEKGDRLFFSSDGHPGYGNLDIFESVYTFGNWSNPRNLKSPVNSVGNDFGFISGKDVYHGYFVSNRYETSVGGNDIYTYSFVMPEPKDTTPVLLPSRPFISDTVFVFFKTASSFIDPVFTSLLDSIAGIMADDPSLKLNVVSWADVHGSDSINKNICNERAGAVANWFTSKGVSLGKIIKKPSGVSRRPEIKQIDYHVQIGILAKAGAQDYYSQIIKNEALVDCLKSGNKYYYYAGNGTLDEMKTLQANLKIKHRFSGFICASYCNYFLLDEKYAPNRRVDIYFSKN